MNEGKYILFFLGGLGAFNGLVISIYLLFLSRKKNLSAFFLGCLLLMLSIRIGKSVFVYFNPALPKIYLQIGLSACFLIGPALYYFVRSTLEQRTNFPRSWKLQIAALVGIILLTGILFPYAIYPRYWNHYIVYFIYAEWLLYMIATAIALRQQWAKLFVRTPGASNPEKWLLAIYAGNALIFLSFLLSLFLAPQYNIYFSSALIFSFLLYLVIFVLLYRKKTNDLFNTAPPRYTVKKISDHDAATLLNALDQLMVEKELYKNPNLTLGELAKAVNLSSHQLSQVLNDNLGKPFSSFINEYRINAACKMITANHPFSLEAIGYEVGFNSKSTFYASFKKIKGTTPLLYKERLDKSKAS
ncbi:AraC family transcriptional regulator [Chitinophaga niastensis]|uniref:AraC family transcriptional regulator n=1 Tax=Chitinophaga niastensis TaxID=536980 RepID=A0A2P8HLT4_CHINA|nr:helix-turn-helix domain-containing protein [Chitinophaga niastensis]PSL47170.1 AraC family transcriptional regulator [Chitinophaga niastensis]